MVIWFVSLAIAVVALAAGIYYLARRVHSCPPIAALSHRSRVGGWAASFAVVLLAAVILTLLLDTVNTAVVLLHLIFFLLVSSLVGRLIIRLHSGTARFHLSGVIALVITAAYLAAGAVSAYNVQRTAYSVSTHKEVGSLRVAMFADSHVGTTFGGKGFAKCMEELQAQQPDIILIVGDFVDESTTRENMVEACRALGKLEVPYGVWFVFGNHDKGLYGTSRGYDGDDLVRELEANGVHVLQDESVLIDDRFYLVGRKDASEQEESRGGRADISDLTASLDPHKYSIVLDHQPHDYTAEAEADADLVLSGHTHGGQLIPLGFLMDKLHLGGTDSVYGYTRRENTDFIVTSGISDWAIKFKTGCISEYVIIDIAGSNAAAEE
mgnify:FL=1